jgi:hypothetical protein
MSLESSSTFALTSLRAAAINAAILFTSNAATLQNGFVSVTKQISDLKTLPTPAITS